MYMCPIPNGFRDRDISLYSSKIVDKKEILRTVSNSGIYCSSDNVVHFTYYKTFSKIPPSASMHFTTRVRTCFSVVCTVPCTLNSSISENFRNRTHVNIHFFLRMTGIMHYQIIDLSSWDTLYSLATDSVIK
jgi:hypothetical protein